MLSLLQSSIVFCAVALLLRVLWVRSKSAQPNALPPGPRGDPLIGHVRLIPKSRPELTYMKWGKEYSKKFSI